MEKSNLFPYLSFVLAKKSLWNRNCLNYTRPTKVVNVLTYIRTKHTIVGPVKKLNCLNDVLCFFVLVKSYREKKNKKFKTALITSFILLLSLDPIKTLAVNNIRFSTSILCTKK